MARQTGQRAKRPAIVLCLGIFCLLSACAKQEAHLIPVYGPHYCYRTLAYVDCHREPLAGEEDRRVGHYEAPAYYTE